MAHALFRRGLRPMPSLLHDTMSNSALYSKFSTSVYNGGKNNPHIGIYFGTMNSYVAVMENETPKVIKTLTSEFFMNSEVYQPAEFFKNPEMCFENVVYGLKRILGRKFDDPFIQNEMKVVPYSIVRAVNGDAWLESSTANGVKMFSPAQLLTPLLKELKRNAESYLNKSVTRAVITYPSYFSDYQLRQLVKAGLHAGFDKLLSLDETTATAIAFGLNKKEEGCIFAVVDIGHRTCDVSILQVAGDGCFNFRAPTNSDMFLGGVDFDDALLDHLTPLLSLPPRFTGFLQDNINKTYPIAAGRYFGMFREQLSHELQTVVLILALDKPRQYSSPSIMKHTTLSRSKFENLVDHVIERIKYQVESSLKEVGVAALDVEEVLLVGRVARTPIVEETVTQVFGKSPSREVLDPEEAVALGAVAAIQAGHFGENAWND